MKRNNLLGLSFVLALGTAVLFSSCEKEESPIESSEINEAFNLKSSKGAQSYIVVFNNDFDGKEDLFAVSDYDKRKDVMKGYLNRFLQGNGIGNENLGHTYSNALYGFSAKLSAKQVERLLNDPRVDYLEEDQMISLGKPSNPGGKEPPSPDPQVVPYGIARVGGPGATTTNKAFVIDSGIDLDHPDLNVDVSTSRTFVNRTESADDDNGHGTHCAGIIAAVDNAIGVVGVSPGSPLVAVKVLNRRGSGTWSDVLAGIDYVKSAASNGDVANLSLGGGASTTIDNAVIALAQSGVKVAVAAGNESTHANNSSPARANHANIYTVSAMDSNDEWAYFSNYGNPPVDYCAPGYRIFSTYKNGDFATLSGTSMAAPHVAGILLLGNISTDGYVSGDPDGNPDPIASR